MSLSAVVVFVHLVGGVHVARMKDYMKLVAYVKGGDIEERTFAIILYT